jgi:hypothetical protein
MKEHVFGVEQGHGDEVVSWINEQADSTGLKLKVKLSGSILSTPSLGDFELFLISNDSLPVRKLILRAGKRLNLKIIEGGYKEEARILRRKKSDYAKVLKGDKIIGHLELETPRFGAKKWTVKLEERR